MTKTILVLAANPKETNHLRLDEEVREIENGLQRAHKRDEYTLVSRLAVRRVDIRRAMLDLKPNIVHFCGHGGQDRIVIEDEVGHAESIDSETLAGFFELFADKVQCVILNACYSETQANAIARHIHYVVGMNKQIGDQAAIEFSVAFYDALAAGENIEFAYKLACNSIRWSNMPEHLTPVLKIKGNSNESVVDLPLKSQSLPDSNGSDAEFETSAQQNNMIAYLELQKAVNDLARKTAPNSNPIYSRWLLEQSKALSAKVLSWVNGYVEYSPELSDEKMIDVINNAKLSGFATQFVRSTQGWDVNKKIYCLCRELPSRNVSFTRLFILDGKQALNNKSLQEHVELDTARGIAVLIVFVQDIRDVNAIKEFNIWDEKFLCSALVDPLMGRTISWRMEVSSERILEAQQWKSHLLLYSSPASNTLNEVSHLDEVRYKSDFGDLNGGGGQNKSDLLLSAHLQLEYSQRYCVGGNVDPVSCQWYHGAWQYLRLVDMVVTPDRHVNFFQKRLVARLNAKTSRILICGLADYDMLAHVRSAIQNSSGGHEITILDICRTPLKMCEWYAEKYGLAINIVRNDALDSQFKDGTFDVIITDAMLTRFTPAERVILVAEWKRILRSSGVVLTTARIAPGVLVDRPNRDKAMQFVQKARDKAQSISLDIDPGAFEKLAADYVRNILSVPFDSDTEINNLFSEFEVKSNIVESKGKFEAVRLYAEIEAQIMK